MLFGDILRGGGHSTCFYSGAFAKDRLLEAPGVASVFTCGHREETEVGGGLQGKQGLGAGGGACLVCGPHSCKGVSLPHDL